MSLYHLQKFLYELNRDETVQCSYKDDIDLLIENYSRGHAKYHQPSRGFKVIPKIELKGKKSLYALIFCLFLFFFSFIFPVSQMLYWSLKFPKYFSDIDLFSLNFNTLLLVLISTSILVFFAFLTNYGSRISKSSFLNYLSAFSPLT